MPKAGEYSTLVPLCSLPYTQVSLSDPYEVPPYLEPPLLLTSTLRKVCLPDPDPPGTRTNPVPTRAYLAERGGRPE